MLAAVNDYQESIDNVAGKAKPLKHQRRIFADPGRELTRAEYFRLLNAARAAGNKRTQLLLEALCSTGTRVSELQFITAEAVRRHKASIRCKGKFYAYTEGQSFKEIAEYLTTSGTAYHFSDNSWNKNIVARILANEIYCGAKGYPAIISKEVYSQAASIRSNKTVTYSAVLKPFRSDMQCACCGERLYWRPRTQQWTCRQCGMWSKPMQPENMAQQIVDRLYQIQQHPEIIHNPKEQCNTRSIEVAQLDHEIHTALALPELDADAIIDKILRRAELQFNYCAAGDDDPTTMQIKRACKEFKPTDTFPESFYSSIVSKIILHLDTHIDIKLRNGQTL